MALTSGRSRRWRMPSIMVFGVFVLIWGLGIAMDLVHGYIAVGGALISLMAMITLVVTFFCTREPGRWFWLLGISLGLVQCTELMYTVIVGFVIIIVIAATIGGPRSLWLTLISVGMVVARLFWRLVITRPDISQFISTGLLAGGLAGIGWYIGSLVNRLDRTAEELRIAHHQLEEAQVIRSELMLAEERTRQAQDLHDGLGHQLTLVRMSLDFAQRMKDKDPAAAWAEVGQAGNVATTALQDMRAWVRAMAPPTADGDLRTMLEQLAASFTSTHLDVDVSYAGVDEPLDEATWLFVRRCIQETLTNVLRHSNATNVHIDVARGHRELKLSVLDDGSSHTQDPVVEGFGLRSLRQRAEALGGSSRVTRTPSGGYKVMLAVPLESGDHT